MTTNKNILKIVPSVWQLKTRSGTVQTWNTALSHDLFVTNGYVGPKPSTRPLPVHSYNYYWDHIRATRVYRRNYPDGTQDAGNGDALSTNPSSVAFDPPLNWDRLYDRALSKLNDNVRGSLDLSVDVAEAHQVQRMFSATKRVEDFTKTFSKKFGLVRAAASLRLEFMYGVQPLIGSVFGIADELLRHHINKTQRWKATETDTGYKQNTIMIQTYYGPEYIDKYVNLQMKLWCTVGVTMKVRNEFELSRWTSLNPISIAWELMPYSFVVDWFYNVGGYLRNYETAMTSGGDFVTGYCTKGAAFSGSALKTFQFTNPPGSDALSTDFSGARYNRTLLTSYPVPNKPKLQADLGSSRMLNAAALLGNFLGVRKKTSRFD